MLGYRCAPACPRVPRPRTLVRPSPASRAEQYPPRLSGCRRDAACGIVRSVRGRRRLASRPCLIDPKSFIHHFAVKALLALI